MRHLIRLAIALAVVTPALPGLAAAQGHDLSVDFRMTETGMSGGKPTTGSGTGHAVISAGRARYDMTGSSRMMAMPGTAAGDSMTLILLDSGMTFIYLQPKTKTYMRFRPTEMMEGMQKMMEGMGAAMKFDVTGSDPKVEKIGGGPDILGHHTTHYRISGTMSVKMAAMDHTHAMEMKSEVDEYVAQDMANLMDPFRNLGSNMMGGILGASAKGYMDKMKAARAKVPGLPLRAETHAIVSGEGQASDVKSVQEITAIQMITAAPTLFEPPADYKPMTIPDMAGMSHVRDSLTPTKH